MKEKVFETIRQYKLIEKNDNIVIGVSGGPDSMALLFCLLDFKELLDFNIYICHVNHGVRGQEADKDQAFVEKISGELSLPFFTINVNMITHGKERGISAEEAGRDLRYGFFRQVLENCGGGKIAVAHNMNDQAETLLMRFMRGTGIDGLKGMDFKTNDIIRPILGINRWEIEDYIKTKKIPTVLDKTNLQSIYTRNKIRLELIPYMEKNFNPRLIDSLWRMSRLASLDGEFLDQHTREVFEKALRSRKEKSLTLSRDIFLSQHKSIQQRLIRYSISLIKGDLQGISETQVSLALELFENNETGKKVNLIQKIVGKNIYEDIFIGIEEDRHEGSYSYGLTCPGSILLGNKYLFQAEVFDNGEGFSFTSTSNVEYFDLDKIRGKLEIRNRRDGDRFNPYGMGGSKKLKDFFIDEKISRELRNQTPLIVDDENILWLVGYRRSDFYKITEDTKKILALSFKKVSIT